MMGVWGGGGVIDQSRNVLTLKQNRLWMLSLWNRLQTATEARGMSQKGNHFVVFLVSFQLQKKKTQTFEVTPRKKWLIPPLSAYLFIVYILIDRYLSKFNPKFLPIHIHPHSSLHATWPLQLQFMVQCLLWAVNRYSTVQKHCLFLRKWEAPETRHWALSRGTSI